MRKPDEPELAPDEPYDSRSLFERLEEQKKIKQDEWDATHDIKNVVRGIDDDEAAFLDKVDDVKAEIEYKRLKEERNELEEYRKMKDRLLEEDETRRLKAEIESSATKNKSKIIETKKQSKLLLGAVVKKRTKSESDEAKVAEKKPKLGALAGLGDYASSSEDEGA